MDSTTSAYFSYGIPNPSNPTLLLRQELQSFFISPNGTLSWGLFGPESDGYTEARSKSKTSPEKWGSFPLL